jgi:hypothetical protein
MKKLMKPPSLGSASNPEQPIHNVTHNHNTAIISEEEKKYIQDFLYELRLHFTNFLVIFAAST